MPKGYSSENNLPIWMMRAKHGRPKKYTPEDLEEMALKYFEWVESNPIKEDTLVVYQGVAEHEPLLKKRAMTIAGFRLYSRMGRKVWDRYAHDPEFEDVISWIKDVCYTQKFEGAAAGIFSAVIIARDLGLVEKSESKTDGELKINIIKYAGDDGNKPSK